MIKIILNLLLSFQLHLGFTYYLDYLSKTFDVFYNK